MVSPRFTALLHTQCINLSVRYFFQVYPQPASRALQLLQYVAYIPLGADRHYHQTVLDIEQQFRVYDVYSCFSLKDLNVLCLTRLRLIKSILLRYVNSEDPERAREYAADLVARGYLANHPGDAFETIQRLKESGYGAGYPPDIQPFPFYSQVKPKDLGQLMMFHLQMYSYELKQSYKQLNPLIQSLPMKAVS